MSRKTKKTLTSISIILTATEHSNEAEIAAVTALINALVLGNGKIGKQGYDALIEALEPLIIKEVENE